MSPQIDLSKDLARLEPTPLTMNLKAQLKYYLDLRSISAAELSRKTGVSKQVLSLWLDGSKPKKIEQVKLVSTCLGTSIDNLLFGEGQEDGEQKITELDALMGNQWISGVFEVRFRRIKR